MFWRVFRKTFASAPSQPDRRWWAEADRVADEPTAEAIDALERSRVSGSTDLDAHELEEEMVYGLRQMLSIAASAELPVIRTQHRVIGVDACHFVTPVMIPPDAGASATLFLTTTRCLLVGSKQDALAWHRVRQVTRVGRRVIMEAGPDRAMDVLCNTFGDALIAAHLARRLARAPKPV